MVMKLYLAGLSLILLVGYTAASTGSERNVIAETHLATMAYDLRIAALPDYEKNEALRQIIADSLLTKLLIVQSTFPDIGKLDGQSLESLCFLAQQKQLLAPASENMPVSVGVMYLERIEAPVSKRIAQLQKTLLGTGCSISP